MQLLTDLFFLISTALMIPVMLTLLLGLVYVLILVGATIREYVDRMKHRKERQAYLDAVEKKTTEIPTVSGSGELIAMMNMIGSRETDSQLMAKKLADLEIARLTELEKVADMTKYGPALGLMGTLIPLGPALVGLAEGDLKTMSTNMIVAFATTIVGVFISLLALSVHSMRKRWFRADSLLLNFAAERLGETAGNENNPDSTGAKS